MGKGSKVVSRPRPYVGVSGVSSPKEQEHIRKVVQPIIDKDRATLFGVKATHGPQWLEQRSALSGYSKTHYYPVGKKIKKSLNPLSKNEMGIAQVHLDPIAAAKEGIREREYEKRFIEKLVARRAVWLSGVQFDRLDWDTYNYTELLQQVKNEVGTVILQCHGEIMQRHTPGQVVERLKLYEGLVDHVLFDASEGRGIPMQPQKLKPFVNAVYSIPDLGVGVAGGLDDRYIISRLGTLLSDFPDLSFDAEGKLRADDKKKLDKAKIARYLRAAHQNTRPAQMQQVLFE